MQNYDFIVVGAGITGSVCAYELSKSGFRVLVIDKNNFVGGLCHTDDVFGVPVHTYGPHIFHTDDEDLWSFVNEMCELIPYTHNVVASVKGRQYTMPINLDTIEQLYGIKCESKDDVDKLIDCDIIRTDCPANLEEYAISCIGTKVYETLFRGYTKKQWLCEPNLLSSDIIKRIPIRYNRDNSYFNDKFVGIPKTGWNSFFSNLLSGCNVSLCRDFFVSKDDYKRHCGKIIFTGSIDKYFDFSCGKLEYIGHKFMTDVNRDLWVWNAPVVNYTSDAPDILRKTNYTNMYGFNRNVPNIIMSERSVHSTGDCDHYPVKRKENEEMIEKYLELTKNERGVLFIGRCAEYKYYDMDDSIINARTKIKNVI